MITEQPARVRSLCRRTALERPRIFDRGDLRIDRGRHEVRRGDVLLALTSSEFPCSRCWWRASEHPSSRAGVFEHAWDRPANPATNVLDVLIAQLCRNCTTRRCSTPSTRSATASVPHSSPVLVRAVPVPYVPIFGGA